MPKFTRNISDADKAQIQAAGQNPAEYLLDEEAGELIHQDDAPGLGIGGNLMEAAKGVGRGALSVVSAAPSLSGTIADAIRRSMGTYDPNNPSEFTKLAKGIESFAPEADPRAHWLVSGGGEALGNIGGMVVGGGLVSKLGKKAIERTALALGAEQMAADTAEQELARQLREGEQVSPWKVGGKAVAVGSVGSGIEALGGVGKLLDDLKKPANTLGQIGKRAGINVGTGSLTEMAQQGFQDKLVEGEISGENLFRAGVLGGLAQGATSAGLDVLLRDKNVPWMGEKTVVEEEDTSGLHGNETPAASYTPPEETVAATLRRQEMDKKDRPKRAISNPVDDVADKLIDSGVALDKEKLLKLYEVWGGQEENVDALNQEARRMQDETHALGPVKPRTTLDVIGEEQTIRANYDRLIANEESRITKSTKSLEEVASIIADPATPQGTRARAQSVRDRAQAELVAAQNNLQTLLTQRTTELGGIRPADPIDTRVATVPPGPTIDISDPATRTTVTREAQTAGFPNPSRITDTETLQRGNMLPESTTPPPTPQNPQVVPEAIGPAIPMGTGQRASERAALAPTVPPVDPVAEAARLQREKERQILSGQEGEQGSPFGEGVTRYSGINPKTLLEPAKELARRARRWLNPNQLQNGTYMLSGVAGLNEDRPWGMQLVGDGKLPTSGLVQKMAANIPKGEMEVYKAAGLEEWLKGKGRVGKEELQQWMIENGPEAEVKELRPQIVTAAAKEYAQLKHELETTTNHRYEHRPNTGQPGQDGRFIDWAPDEASGIESSAFYYEPTNDSFVTKRGQIVSLPKDLAEKLKRMHRLSRMQQSQGSSDATIGRYGIEPRPVEQLEGPVELLVRVPRKHSTITTSRQRSDGTWELVDGNTGKVLYTAPTREILDRKFNENKSPLWDGNLGHHGKSGDNLVGFGRANVETLPDGKKVLHLFEVQSDWGRFLRKAIDNREKYLDTIKIEQQLDGTWVGNLRNHPPVVRPTKEDVRQYFRDLYELPPGHPLLPESNRLVLKAGIKYAIDNGLDGIAISDGETAMITEEHDEAGSMVRKVSVDEAADGYGAERMPNSYGTDWRNGTYVTLGEGRGTVLRRLDKPENNPTAEAKEIARELADAGYGQKEGVYIPQEDGMRLNYDQKLPKIAKELTGFDGERVSFGEHWKAMGEDVEPQEVDHPVFGRTQQMMPVKKPRPGLIFKNPDGTPKTDITARVYPLDKVKKMLDDQAAFTLFGSDKSYYSGIDPKILANFYKTLFPHGSGINLLYALHKGTTSRMATLNPEGALLKWLSDGKLTPFRTEMSGKLQRMAKPVEEFLNSPTGVKWLNERSSKKDWDVSGLTGKDRVDALQYRKLIEEIADIIDSHGIRVAELDPATGKTVYRRHQKAPGYFPWAIGEQVFTASGDELANMKKDFTAAWVKKFGKGADRAADVAFQNLLGMSRREGVGSSPAFGPVRLPQGITLPESMRSRSPVDSLNRYINGVAKDVAWAVMMEKDPVGRRVLGVHHDPGGKDTFKTDPTTWDQAPDAWKYAVREGKRVRAKWALEADENKPPNSPINLFNDSKLLADMQNSYRMMASPNPNMQAGSNLASSIILGTPSGIRDVGSSLVNTSALVGPGRAIGGALSALFDPKGAAKRARTGGAMQEDMLVSEQIEAGKVMARSIMNTAKNIRRYVTGREQLDMYGQMLMHDALTSLMQTPEGKKLIEEFGPAFDANMPEAEKIKLTAARLVERWSNRSTAQNITPGMLPHSSSPLSTGLSLTRWSQSQWNNFSEDIINKWLNDKKNPAALKRFLNLALGGIVVGSAIDKLVAELYKRKPSWLSWGELLGVFGSDKIENDRKAKEFAYTAAAELQTLGALGTMGDAVMLPLVKKLAGEKNVLKGGLDIQYPAAIVGMDWLEKTGSFMTAVQAGRVSKEDFFQYLEELTKTAQNVRMGRALMERAGVIEEEEPIKGTREMRVFERVLGKDPKKFEEPRGMAGQPAVLRQDPFSFSRQMMRGNDPENYREFLQGYRRRGEKPPPLDKWTMSRRYYQELEAVIGEEEARKRMEKDKEVDRAIREKNREIRKVR